MRTKKPVSINSAHRLHPSPWPSVHTQQESVDEPKGRMNYPEGFVSSDKQWLHLAFDNNRHRAVHYSAKLPPLP